MGGYNSTRWTWATTRQDTDPLMKLDVRFLHRVGALAPRTIAFPTWARRGEPSGDIATRTNADASVVTLIYRHTDRYTGFREDVRDDVALEWLDNTLGGVRAWFRCPGCFDRRAVLFCRDGRFRCRACHRLAYTSTREDRLDRARRRCNVLQTRLGLTSARWDDVPAKPKGMHWATYERLCDALMAAQDDANGAFMDGARALLARSDRLLARYKAP